MAYVAACRDMGSDCDAVLRGDTMAELQQKMAEHGKSVHGIDISSLPEDQREKMSSIIRQE